MRYALLVLALVLVVSYFVAGDELASLPTSYRDALDAFEARERDALSSSIPVEPLVIRGADGVELETHDLSDPSSFWQLTDYNTGELGHGYIRCRTVVYVDSAWTRYPTGIANWRGIVPIRMDTLFVQVFERP